MPSSFFVVGLLVLLPAFSADTKEQQRADTPTLGFAFGETSRELRAVLGVPGASRWSDPIPLPEGVSHLKIANGHRWALAMSSADPSAPAGVLSLETFKVSRLDGAWKVDGVLFSPRGSAMAIRTGGVMTLYSGLPDAPAKTGEFESTAGEQVAVSDSGEAVALRDGRIVKALGGELILACPGDCRMAYFPNGSDLAIFESGQLVELRGGRESRVIAEGLNVGEIQQLGAGSARLVIAGKEKLIVVERASGAIAAEESLGGGGADRMEAMRLPGTWLLSAAEDRAAWLYSQEGVRFVPAAARSKEQ